MRWLSALLLVLLLPTAGAQSLAGNTESSIGAVADVVATESVVVRVIDVTFAAQGFLCTDETVVTVPIILRIDGNATGAIEPSVLRFTLPAGTSAVTRYEDARSATVILNGRANTTATIHIDTGAPTGGCMAIQPGADETDSAAFTVAWPSDLDPEPVPEQIMPAPWWLALAAVVPLARRSRDNGPK